MSKFKPGESGNPGGRPKADPQVVEILTAACPKAAQKLVELIDSTDVKLARVACDSILDRVLGKATQPISGDDSMAPIGVRDYSKLTKAERETLRELAMKASS